MTTARTSTDALLRSLAALPNAGNTVNTAAIDLGQNPAFALEAVQVKLSSEEATGANSKNINMVLQHSDEESANFTNVSELAAPLLSVSESGSAYPAGSASVYLPPSAKRYLRASATGEATGGNASNGNFTVELLF